MGEKKWYVVRTAGSKEKKAKQLLEKEISKSGLEDQVDQVLVPVQTEIVTKNGKRKEVERILFPGYIYIHAELSAELEYIIRGRIIPGIAGFLTENKGTSTQVEKVPVPLRDDEAARLLGQQDENKQNPATTEVHFEVGDQVQINDGPFTGFPGTVEEVFEDRSKIKVVVLIFGRKSPVELSFTQVTKE